MQHSVLSCAVRLSKGIADLTTAKSTLWLTEFFFFVLLFMYLGLSSAEKSEFLLVDGKACFVGFKLCSDLKFSEVWRVGINLQHLCIRSGLATGRSWICHCWNANLVRRRWWSHRRAELWAPMFSWTRHRRLPLTSNRSRSKRSAATCCWTASETCTHRFRFTKRCISSLRMNFFARWILQSLPENVYYEFGFTIKLFLAMCMAGAGMFERITYVVYIWKDCKFYIIHCRLNKRFVLKSSFHYCINNLIFSMDVEIKILIPKCSIICAGITHWKIPRCPSAVLYRRLSCEPSRDSWNNPRPGTCVRLFPAQLRWPTLVHTQKAKAEGVRSGRTFPPDRLGGAALSPQRNRTSWPKA